MEGETLADADVDTLIQDESTAIKLNRSDLEKEHTVLLR